MENVFLKIDHAAQSTRKNAMEIVFQMKNTVAQLEKNIVTTRKNAQNYVVMSKTQKESANHHTNAWMKENTVSLVK